VETIRFTFIRTIWKHPEYNLNPNKNQYAVKNRRINQHQKLTWKKLLNRDKKKKLLNRDKKHIGDDKYSNNIKTKV